VICLTCGAKNEEGARFCDGCGVSLSAEGATKRLVPSQSAAVPPLAADWLQPAEILVDEMIRNLQAAFGVPPTRLLVAPSSEGIVRHFVGFQELPPFAHGTPRGAIGMTSGVWVIIDRDVPEGQMIVDACDPFEAAV
jgi:hypothetical protein